jgi:hypothetical protein
LRGAAINALRSRAEALCPAEAISDPPKEDFWVVLQARDESGHVSEATGGPVELTATVSEAVADAFENAETLLAEGSDVVVRDIAGPDSSLATTHGSSSACA